MRSLLEDSSVERQCTVAARYVLHDVTHELVSRKNAEKCTQRRLSMPTLTALWIRSILKAQSFGHAQTLAVLEKLNIEDDIQSYNVEAEG